MIKQDRHLFKGLNMDSARSIHSQEYLVGAQNIRISSSRAGTLLAITSFKGNKSVKLYSYTKDEQGNITGYETYNGDKISGICLGSVVLNNYLILFVHESEGVDVIYRLTLITEGEENGGFLVSTLAKGDMNWDLEHPIEAIPNYELDTLQTVYYVDGKNILRKIYIDDNHVEASSTVQSTGTLTGDETLTVTKQIGGEFPPGTVQYAVTYLNPNGQESSIIAVSQLQYTVANNTPYGPDETVPVAFSITIDNIQEGYEYLRVYAIVKTSNNATPQCRVVQSVKIGDQTSITVIDDGIKGSAIDGTFLLLNFTGAPVGSTIGVKDDLLFLGNIKESYNTVEVPFPENTDINNLTTFEWVQSGPTESTLYNYDTEANYPRDIATSKYDSNVKTFKYNEIYRIGLQFQHQNGLWSEPIELNAENQFVVDKHPDKQQTGVKVVHGKIVLNSSGETFQEFINVRPVVIYPAENEKRVIAQGVLCPTVFNIQQRKDGTAHALSSWFFRPNTNISFQWYYPNSMPGLTNHGNEANLYNYRNNVSDPDSYVECQSRGIWYEFRHMYPIPSNHHKNAEIQSIWTPPRLTNTEPYKTDYFNCAPDKDNPYHFLPNTKWLDYGNVEQWKEYFYIDSNILTFHSPDIEFNVLTQQAAQDSNLKLRILGTVPANFTSSYERITGTPTTAVQTYQPDNASIYSFWGFYNNPNTQVFGTRSFGTDNTPVGALGVANMFLDFVCVDRSNDGKADFNDTEAFYNYAIYPWHRDGALNNYGSNYTASEVHTSSGLYDQKFLSNFRVSSEIKWLDTPITADITTPGIWQSDWSANNILTLNMSKRGASGDPGDLPSSIIYKGALDFLSVVTANNFLANATNQGYDVQYLDQRSEDRAYSYRQSHPDYDEYTTLNEYIQNGNRLEGQRLIINNPDDGDLQNGGFSQNALELTKSRGYPICASPLCGKSRWETANIEQTEHLKRGAYRWISWLAFLDCLCYTQDNSTPEAGHEKVEIWQTYGMDPVPIQYKSTTHAAFALCCQNEQITTLPQFNCFSNADGSFSSLDPVYTYVAPWIQGLGNVRSRLVSNSGNQIAEGLYLAELYREDTKISNSESSETWYLAGPQVQLNKLGNTTIYVTEGDTYFQRYDCLKTYQYNSTAKNNIVEIYSFLCETRVNLEGRYDINKGNYPDNTAMNPNNFNIINNGYTQDDIYFAQQNVQNIGAEAENYNTSIIWSEPKINGEEVDSWLQFNSTSIYNLDGSLGSVTALKKFNNELYVFQEGGIGQILYNNRVQIPASDGMPIEIANSQRVQGVRYLTVNGGCQNKWAITQSKHGIWFIDNRQSSFNLFDGNNITDITQQQGMRSWINNNNLSLEPWNLVNTQSFNNYRLFYDQTLDDLFIVGNTLETSPYYSTLTQSFNSFVNYENTSFMLNLRDNFYGIKQNGNSFNVWMQNDGDYLDFYDTRQPLSISFISNQDEPLDKTFDWIEYRADALTTEDKVNPNESFTHIDVENEYQKGSEKLSYRSFTYPESKDEVDTKWKLSSNLKRKFRIWRALIPRDNSQQGKPALNRMRNPWLKITLTKEADPETVIPNMFTLYDLSVQYSI